MDSNATSLLFQKELISVFKALIFYENKGVSDNDHIKKSYLAWLINHIKDIELILTSLSISATTFSDYYKFTMTPVIKLLETFFDKQGKKINVTMGVDIRDAEIKKALVDNKDSREFQLEIYNALIALTKRTFDKNIFEELYKIKPTLNPDHFKDLYGKPLADKIHEFNKNEPDDSDESKVVISCYIADDITNPGTKKFYIEATGLWSRVTWLETSMMQCVYNVILTRKLRQQSKTQAQWLFEALFRCFKSIDLVNRLNKDRINNELKGAVFSGRRTAGLFFLTLQNYMISDLLNNCIGTSSVDVWYILSHLNLTQIDKNKMLEPVGTHAHELQMVIACLFPKLDDNDECMPVSQALSHYLYYKESVKSSTPIPMLTDTFGTRAFMRMASNMMIEPNKSLMTIFDSARQDSGDVEEFTRIMEEYQFKGSVMASEVDNEQTLEKIAQSKKQDNMMFAYQTFGAGGFFGDSEVVWNTSKTGKSINMAVKPVRVFLNDQLIGYPIKLGDGSGKLSVDGTMCRDNFCRVVERAMNIKDKGFDTTITNSKQVHDLFHKLLVKLYI